MSAEDLKEEGEDDASEKGGDKRSGGAKSVGKGSAAGGSDKGSQAGSDAFEATNLADLPFMRRMLENRYFNTLVIQT